MRGPKQLKMLIAHLPVYVSSQQSCTVTHIKSLGCFKSTSLDMRSKHATIEVLEKRIVKGSYILRCYEFNNGKLSALKPRIETP